MTKHILRVLIVDDEKGIREPLAERLQRLYRYHVDMAADGKEALHMINEAQGRYDVALIDQVLEGEISGLDVLRKIKSTYPYIQVIVITGWEDEMKKEGVNVLRAGAYRYIAKPLNIEELALTIRFASEESQTRQERVYMAALVKVGQALAQTIKQDEQLKLAWDFVCDQLDVSTFFIGLYLPEKKRIYFPLAFDDGQQIDLTDNILGKSRREWGLAGYVVKTGEEILWSTFEEMERVHKVKKIAPIVVGKPSASGFCIPLQMGEQIRGMISAQSYQPHIFTSVLQNALRALSSQLSVALENSRLFAETKQKATDIERQATSLAALQELALTINSSLELKNILTKTCKAAVEFFHADHSGLVFFDTELEQGIVEAEYPDLGINGMKIPLRNVPAEERLIETLEPLIVDNVYSEESLGKVRDILVSMNIQSTLIVPVIGKNGLLGSFSLDAIEQQRHFMLEDIALAKTFADQVAVAIENARLITREQEATRRMRKQADRLRVLYEIGKEIISAQEVDTIWDSIAKHLIRLVGARRSLFLLMDNKGKRLIKATGQGYPPEHLQRMTISEVEEGVSGWVLRTKEAVLIENVQSDPRNTGKALEKARDFETAPLIIAPLLIKDEAIGTLTVANSVGDLPFDEDDKELVVMLAAQAAIAIENARLFSGLNETKEQLDALIENSFDAVIAIDRDRKIIAFNRRAEELFGWTSEEMMGHTTARLHIEIETAREIFETVNREGRVNGWNVELKYRDGTHIPVLLSAVLIRDSQSTPIGQAGFIHDLRKIKIREELLIALDESSRRIRAEKQPARLLHEIVRLAAQLMGCTAGGLCLNHAQLEEVEVSIVYGLPSELIGNRLPHTENSIGLVATTGRPNIIDDYSLLSNHKSILEAQGIKSIISLPLKQANDVEAVLWIADTTGFRHFTDTDLEILDRFARQASIALQTSRLMNQEQRMSARLAVLHRISDYIQDAKDLDKILHVVLTGVTSEYGLGFNRAALFLLDQLSANLIGRMGIGYLKEQDAYKGWVHYHQHGLDDFERYLEWLEQDALPMTAVDERIRELRLPLGLADSDAFSRVLFEKMLFHVTQGDLIGLPAGFVEAFEPASPIIIIPLLVRDRAIGLLVADNKFTRLPITEEDVNSLMTFTNTAAIAIENARLFQEAEAAREKIRLSFQASGALIASQDPEAVLKTIVEQAHVATGASWVSLLIIDEIGQVHDVIATRKDKYASDVGLIREDGISREVFRTAKPVIIRNVFEEKERVNPRMFEMAVRSALCMPLSLQRKQIGVMWVHYDDYRLFPDYEIEALQLYINQAAIAYDSARQMRALENMRKAAEVMSGVFELPHVLQQIVESANEVLQADSSAIWSYDNVHDQFNPEELVACGIHKDVLERFRKNGLKKGGTAHGIMDQGWLSVMDVSDPKYNFIGPSTVELLQGISAKSFQGVALKVGNERLGVLYVNYNQSRSFSQEDQRTLETFAYHAALVLKKARLIEQVEKAQDAARVVAQVTVLGNREATLLSVAEGTKKTVGCDAVTLFAYDQAAGKLDHPPIMVGVNDPEKASRYREVLLDSIVYEMLQQDSPYIVQAVEEDALFKDKRFAQAEGIKSCVAIPLKVMEQKVVEQKVGVMFVNYRSPHRFTKDEITRIELFANQAAVAIRNAKLLADISHRNTQLQTITEVSKSTSTFLDLEKLMSQSVNVIQDRFGLYYVGLFLVDEAGKYAVLRAGSGEPGRKMVRARHKLATDNHSMIGWSIANAQARIASDVTEEAIHFYNPDLPETRSEIALPLISHDRCIGALTVQSNKEVTFLPDDIVVLQAMVDQLAIAIENARVHEDLKRIKGLVGSKTATDWMRMVSMAWGHAVRRESSVAQNYVELIRQDLVNSDMMQVHGDLSKLAAVITRVGDIPIIAPLAAEDTTMPFLVNDLLQQHLQRVWLHEPYKAIMLVWDLQEDLDEIVSTRASPEWIRRAIEILVDNAVLAMLDAESVTKELTVGTRISGTTMEIHIKDCGPGIPYDIQSQIFNSPIDKPPGSRGAGLGLIQAKNIAQTYGGDLCIGHTGEDGTTMILSLQIERQEN